jgi:sugar/nucleoside kinase (ribokinase family)
VLVCSLGDLTLDVLVRLSGPIAAAGDTDAEITLSPGGQGANVAAWASALGARARFVGKRGDDGAGRLACEGLEARGIEVLGPAAGANGVICSLVAPDGERSMLSDRGAAADLAPEALDPGWLAGVDHLFVSGYALLREPARAAALRAVELARTEGAAISVDLSSWSAILETGVETFRAAVEAAAPDVVFANEDEERVVGRIPGTAWILKRGAAGALFGDEERAAVPVEHVVDTTGAGDAFAAGWIVGGPELALQAAARCVARLGSLP